MKKLKIIFMFIGIVILIAIVGLFFFVTTADVNKYKPQIISQLSNLLDRNVKIDSLSLSISLNKGTVLEIRGLLIEDDPEFSSGYFLDVHKVHLNVDLASYLTKREVHVSECNFISAKLRVLRKKDGTLNIPQIKRDEQQQVNAKWSFVKDAYAQGTDKHKSKFKIDPSKVFIKSIRLQESEVVFDDESLPFVKPVVLLDVNVTIRNISFNEPFKVTTSASFLSRVSNLKGEATLRVDAIQKQMRVDNLEIKSDLSQIEIDELYGLMPALHDVIKREPLQGSLMLAVNPLIMSQEEGILILAFDGRLSDGRVALNHFDYPAENIDFALQISDSDLTIKEASMNFASGKVTLQGNVTDFDTDKNYVFKLNLDGLSLKELVAGQNLPSELRGKVGGRFEASGSGFLNKGFEKILSANGFYEVTEGEIIDVNLLKLVLSRISIVPNLVERIEANLPQQYKDKLQKNNTTIDKLNGSVAIDGGKAYFNKSTFEADGIQFVGDSTLTFDQYVTLQGSIFLEEDLSLSIIASVDELAFLLNENNQIQIPLKPYQGAASQIKVFPNMEVIGRNAIRTTGKTELKKVIFDALNLEPTPTTDATQKEGEIAPQERRPEEILIENVLDAILK